MKELRFLTMALNNFKEFRGEHKINLAKLGPGVHFISGWNHVEPRLGSNGSGKSTIWDALVWCLYGKTVAGLKGPEVRTWGGKEHASVSVFIQSDRGERKLIQRSTKTNGLWIDSKLVEQAEIDQAIGMTYDIFLLAIVHGQGEALFLDLRPTEKMVRLSEALDLDRWEARSAAAKKAVQAIDSDMAELSGRKSELGRTAIEAERQLTELEKQSDTWEAEQAEIGKTNAKSLKEAKKALEFAANEMGNHDLALDGAETEAKATRSKKAKLDAEYQRCMGVVGAAAAAVSVLMDERQKLDTAKTDRCPTCNQKIKSDDAGQHAGHVARRAKELDQQIKDGRAINQAAVPAADGVERKVRAAAKELRGFEDAADAARDGYTRAHAAHAEVAAKIKQLEDEAVRFAMGKNPYTDLLKKARTQLRRIDHLREDMDVLVAAAEAKRERTLYWIAGFKNVRLYLLQEVLEELTAVTQTLLPQIGLENWIIEYAMERETQAGKVLPGLNVNIIKPGHDRGAKWEAWSGGEGQRLRIVGAVALSQVLLRRVGVDCDLIVLDEPTKHLSAEGVADMIDFLAELGRDRQVFYIDHSARPTNRFAKGLRIEKTSEGSRVVP